MGIIKIFNALERLVEIFMGVCLSVMAILLVSNVIMRYFFNTGIPWSEEFTRFLFIWIIFLGAIGALKDNNHLGFTSLIQKLPKKAKLVVYIISQAMVFATLVVFFIGSVRMTKMGIHTLAPATEIPLAFMYGVGIPCSLAMMFIVGYSLYKAFFVKGAIDSLVVLHESEDDKIIEALEAKNKEVAVKNRVGAKKK
jgi:TRAP-type transport system small permease protein